MEYNIEAFVPIRVYMSPLRMFQSSAFGARPGGHCAIWSSCPGGTPHPKTCGLSRHTEKLSAAAKLTHSKYGIRRAPAIGRARQKDTSVATMSNQSSTISANAKAPWCHAKKSQLHRVFTASCTRNKVSAPRIARNPSVRHANHAAMPISAYKRVQTGPKTEGGGAQLG